MEGGKWVGRECGFVIGVARRVCNMRGKGGREEG